MAGLRSDCSSRLTTKSERRFRPGLVLENLEDRLVMSVSPTVTLLSATTHDSQSLSITYRVSDVAEFSITAFRSPNATYDGMNDPRDVVVDTAGIDASVYPSSDTLSLSTPLSVDPSRPYVWVVASPTGSGGTTTPYSETSFRIFTVGAVTHGFEFKPSDTQWVNVMADSLRD